MALLKLDWVDCENWDIFAVLEGRKGQSKAAAQRAKSRWPTGVCRISSEKRSEAEGQGKEGGGQVTSMEDAGAVALRTMRLHLELGEVEAALAVYKKSSRSLSAWQPAESDWVDLIQALLGGMPGPMRRPSCATMFSARRSRLRGSA